MYKIAVLISGNGSNLQAIIDSIESHKLAITIVLVLSDRPNAYGLERAKKAGIDRVVLDPQNHASRDIFDDHLLETLDHYTPDLIVLAGFMRILGSKFVQHFKGRLINIHPSLLPSYKGLQTHEKVLAANEKEHGASVHLVTDDLDGGPILAQSKLIIEADETPESLKNRVHSLEHHLYPSVIRWFAEGKLVCSEEGIFFEGRRVPSSGIVLT